MSEELIKRITRPEVQRDITGMVGNAAYSLLVAIAKQMPESGELEISNGALMEIVSIRTAPGLIRTRKLLIEAGLLSYHSSKNSEGFYKISLP